MRSLYILLLWAMTLPAVAQERPLAVTDTGTSASRLIFAQAESDYQAGRIEQAQELLTAHLNQFRGTVRQGAYRLLALCSLGLDDLETTEKYALLLLKENPYYTSVQDPARFEDIINRLKNGKEITFTTASSREESMEEVPVPVTMITEQMIADCGADNLRDVLSTYVPGMNIVEGTGEFNLAMHGIYSSRQEKIMVMLDGHRLNARSTNAFAPDYAVSLKKIKQIEVLRGPASSLYGNVALTAVVNIITKQGSNVDGLDISGKYGSFSTYHANALFGLTRSGLDIMTWASLYSSDGQEIDYPADATGVWRVIPTDGHVYLQGFNQIPSYDMGVTVRLNNHWKFLTNHRYSKMQSPFTFTASGMSAPYSYDKYRIFDGQKPGRGRKVWSNELEYRTTIKDWDLTFAGYFDLDEYRDYDVVADSLPFALRLPLPEVELLDTISLRTGVYQRPKWNDYTFGINMNASYNYNLGGLGNGDLLLGVQYEYFNLYNADVSIGDLFDRILVEHAESANKLIYGHEISLSGYAQTKHRFLQNLILNAGFRYDFKRRYDESDQTALSPRLCLIYSPGLWSFKLSYSRSFVDAPYLNRASTVESYKGGPHLKPEYMDAIQCCAIFNSPKLHLTYDVTAFYNALSDLIYYDKSAPLSGLPAYMNAGSVKLIGLENAIYYNSPGLRAHMNCSYVQVVEADKYHTSGKNIHLTPSLTINTVGAKKIFADNDGKQSLWANVKMSYWSKQLMRASSYLDGTEFTDTEYEIKPSFIVDMSLEYRIRQLTLKLLSKNLFNTSYTRGTTYNIDIPQLGRSISLEARIHL